MHPAVSPRRAMLTAVTNPTPGPNPAGRLRDLHRELSELAGKLAAGGQLGPKGLRRLDAIIDETARLVERRPVYRRVYERALEIQKRALRPPWAKGRNETGLTEGGHEVLGGLPGTRRGH